MTSSIFRRVWATARKRWGKQSCRLAGGAIICYFHDDIGWRKSHRSGIVLPFWQRTGVFSAVFLTFPARAAEAFVMLSKRRSFSAKIAPTTPEAKSCRMQTGWRRWAPLVTSAGSSYGLRRAGHRVI